MPHKPAHPCKHRGCRNLVRAGESYCDAHKKAHANDFARAHPEYFKLYNNKRWRRYRQMFLAGHPLCVECGHEATVVDHIKDHKGDYDTFWEPSNHAAMCAYCHNQKTGKSRGWGRDAEEEG